MTKLEQLRDIARRLEADPAANCRASLRQSIAKIDPLIGLGDIIPDYDASIDASIGLVERAFPGEEWMIGGGCDGAEFRLLDPSEDHGCIFKTAPTAPIAILKALFAALIQQEEANAPANSAC